MIRIDSETNLVLIEPPVDRHELTALEAYASSIDEQNPERAKAIFSLLEEARKVRSV